MKQTSHNFLLSFVTITFIVFSLLGFLLYAEEKNATASIIAPEAERSLLLDLVKLPNERLITVGERGHILISDDAAESWKQVLVPVSDNLTAIDFYDDKLGLAVGFEQTILLTQDGGESWELVHHKKNAIDSPAFFDVVFLSEKKAIAVGAYGLFFESKDAGKTWTQREVSSLADVYGGFSHFYGLAEDKQTGHIILVGEKYVATEDEDGIETSTGLIAVSRDFGQSWNKIASPYNGSFFGVSRAPDNKIYAYGLKGHLYVSKNNGADWSEVETGTVSGLHGMTFAKDGEWFGVGTSGILLQGSTKYAYPRADRKGRAAIVQLKNGDLIIVGEGGVEKITNNALKDLQQLHNNKE